VLWATAGVVLIVTILFFAHLSTTDLEYSRYNSGWNGVSALFSRLEARSATEIRNPADLDGMSGSLLLIVPEQDITAGDAEHYRSFIERGNTMYIAANRESANTLLGLLGSTIRIQQGRLLSIDAEFTTPASVIAFKTGTDPLTGNVSSVLLNSPAALTGGNTILATSVLTWNDSDGDMLLGRGEKMQSQTVLSKEQIGEGILYVIGDPGIFLNSMIGLDSHDNPRLIEMVLGEEDQILVDQYCSATHRASGPVVLLHVVRDTLMIKIGLLSLALIPIAYIMRRFRSRGDTEET
jgi:hypothetical protein